MSRVFYALIMVFAAIAQATFFPKIWPLEIQPDLTLVLLVVWCIHVSTAEGLTWAFGLGILLDVLALDPLGTNALALLPVVLLAAAFRKQVFRNRLLAPIALMVVATIVHAITLLLLRSSALGDTPLATIARLVLLQSLLNSILVPPLALFAGWLSGRSAAGSRTRRRAYTVRT
jgi:rod shape-determining protein MreD